MPKTWQPKAAKGRFGGFTRTQRARLLAAAIDSDNISYSQIARRAGVSKASVISSKLRPKGNMFRERPVKNPAVAERLMWRRNAVERFIAGETFAKRAVSINDLQKRFGGEKKFLKDVMNYVDSVLSKTAGVRVIRRTKSDQPKRGRGGSQYAIRKRRGSP